MKHLTSIMTNVTDNGDVTIYFFYTFLFRAKTLEKVGKLGTRAKRFAVPKVKSNTFPGQICNKKKLHTHRTYFLRALSFFAPITNLYC